ncbi:MAG: hypothetical protein AAF620_00235 [Bacteroidota bacterium]
MAYTVQYGQSIYDVSIQVYGSLLGVEQLMRDNPDLGLETVLVNGTVLVTDEANIRDNEVVRFLTVNNHIVTNFDGEGEFTDPSLQHEFLGTESGDFIVTELGDEIVLNV